MARTIRPCTVCGTLRKTALAARCARHKTKINPASFANLNHRDPDLTGPQIDALLTRFDVERRRWRAITGTADKLKVQWASASPLTRPQRAEP